MQEYSLDDFLNENEGEKLVATLCQGDDVSIRIQYISDFRSAKVLREIVDSICKWYWVTPKWRTRLVLIIDELNNNAIEYWSLEGENNYFNFILKQEGGDKLYIEASVTDSGNGLSAKKSLEMENLRVEHQKEDFSKHSSIRWRGLFLIITQLVDKLYFRDDSKLGLTVGIQKQLPLSSEE